MAGFVPPSGAMPPSLYPPDSQRPAPSVSATSPATPSLSAEPGQTFQPQTLQPTSQSASPGGQGGLQTPPATAAPQAGNPQAPEPNTASSQHKGFRWPQLSTIRDTLNPFQWSLFKHKPADTTQSANGAFPSVTPKPDAIGKSNPPGKSDAATEPNAPGKSNATANAQNAKAKPATESAEQAKAQPIHRGDRFDKIFGEPIQEKMFKRISSITPEMIAQEPYTEEAARDLEKVEQMHWDDNNLYDPVDRMH